MPHVTKNLRTTLLVFTVTVAVALSIALWAVGGVPFTARTFTLHIVSIYIGAALVLLYRDRTGA